MSHAPILYAEDDENDAFLLKYAFAQAEIPNPLLLVTDAKSAIAYLEVGQERSRREEFPRPCLALLDLKMPGKSGLDILRWIRNQSGLCTLPVLILTSSNLESDIREAYMQGANGYLEKPRSPSEMLVMAKAIRDFWLALNLSAGSGDHL